MGYDEVLTHLGDFGKYQRVIFFLLCLTAMTCAFHKMSRTFVLAKPRFRCLLPFEEEASANYELEPARWESSYPRDLFNGEYNACEHFNLSTSTSTPPTDQRNATTTCERYVYEKSTYHKSAVTEWGLVCSRSFLAATSDAIFMLGVLLGSITFGLLSDRYGRKPIFFISLVLQVAFGIAAGLAPEYVTYTMSRFIVGATTSGVFLVAYVIAMEMVGPPKRMFAGIILMMFFSLGFMLTAVFAVFIEDWRWLQIALSLPGLLFLSYYWIIPESARWLLSQSRTDAVVKNIRRTARFNKVNIEADVLHQLLQENTNKEADAAQKQTAAQPSVLDLMRNANLRRKTLLIFFDWFVNSGTYYGLSWNTNALGGNTTLNFIISGAVELPAYTFLLLTLNRWGRRTILSGCMLMAGVALLLTLLVPTHMDWLIITCAMVGKWAITASYGTIYVFSAEQFPTVVRNVGLGASSMIARVGGILAPYLNLVGEIWRPLPLIICGALAFVGGLLSLLLPETHNKPLPETIEDGENFGKKSRSNVRRSNGELAGKSPTRSVELRLLNGKLENGCEKS